MTTWREEKVRWYIRSDYIGPVGEGEERPWTREGPWWSREEALTALDLLCTGKVGTIPDGWVPSIERCTERFTIEYVKE